MKTLLNIKCGCGYDENLEDNVSERLNWNEDETLDCPDCGNKIKYEGSNKPRIGTAVWVEGDNI